MVERLAGSGRERARLMTSKVEGGEYYVVSKTGALGLVVVCDVGRWMGMGWSDRSLWTCRQDGDSWTAAPGAAAKAVFRWWVEPHFLFLARLACYGECSTRPLLLSFSPQRLTPLDMEYDLMQDAPKPGLLLIKLRGGTRPAILAI